MQFRRFIAALMILLSLTAQAGTAYACAMMPGAALAHDCCPDNGKNHCADGVAASGCCESVAHANALLSHIGGRGSREQAVHSGSMDSSPEAAVESYFLPAAFDTGDRRPIGLPSGANQRRVRPQYLLTARLRL